MTIKQEIYSSHVNFYLHKQKSQSRCPSEVYNVYSEQRPLFFNPRFKEAKLYIIIS